MNITKNINFKKRGDKKHVNILIGKAGTLKKFQTQPKPQTHKVKTNNKKGEPPCFKNLEETPKASPSSN